jgi:hypothetical protein
MTRRKAVPQPESRNERSPKRFAPESGQERPERYAAAALNVLNDNSTAISAVGESDDERRARGRKEEAE